ncbi:hypothetical protein BDV93DRAFT_461759 [Ceratobasidium sp. AG-I]|nr:hypothetical protein BDV93DRAFT_461964 [Ceratobasidium sp. AG-I]KAF8593145.1 hypothetical protein BDV93DRAFT_461759 [Ceratobasidium sp. AG-I]
MLTKAGKIAVPKLNLKAKHAGAYKTRIRSLSRRLIMAGVSAIQTPKVIRMCAQAFGVDLGHIPSPRSVGRFVLEGGIGAGIQMGNILASAQGVTTSMDSTSQRNVNFSSMHIMANSGDTHQQLYLGVESTSSHTSEMQVATLKGSIHAICDMAKRAPKCITSPEIPLELTEVARKLYGANGDHAKDQLKVAQLEKQWKIESWTDYLGNSALLELSEASAESLSQEIQTCAEAVAGGFDIFALLDPSAQDYLREAEYQKRVRQLGSAEFNKKSPSLQQDMSCLIRGGCCMHKDMNASKGGASAMSLFWKANKQLPQPAILFNKDNDATVLLANTSTDISLAEQRAVSVSESGAIKLCSLAGAAFNHKDDKKGHQDSHFYWFEAKYGCSRRFPDTSNVRYSSYIDAATALCTLHSAYIEFMEHCRQKKGSGTLNHLELNIMKALKCPATLAELLVIALYGQAISKPYMRLVRTATVEGKGLAELASLHTQVQHHLELIIRDPLLVLGPTVLAETATLDGSNWDEPAVIDALRRHESVLPYITDLFVAYCQGALQTWRRFTDEFAKDGPLASLTQEQSTKAFMPPTNDVNEGALGTYRVWTRKYPRLTLHKFNAVMINRANGTEDYMETHFTPEQYVWARAEARRIDSSNKEATRKAELVAAAVLEAERNQVVQDKRVDKRHRKEQYISGIQLQFNPDIIVKMKGSELNDQLKAYRQMAKNQRDFPSTSKLNVAGKKIVVAGLALKYAQELLLETSLS